MIDFPEELSPGNPYNDGRWSIALEQVQSYINGNITDVFEQLVASTNPAAATLRFITTLSMAYELHMGLTTRQQVDGLGMAMGRMGSRFEDRLGTPS
mgnify:CR=1 FL=1